MTRWATLERDREHGPASRMRKNAGTKHAGGRYSFSGLSGFAFNSGLTLLGETQSNTAVYR